MVIIGAALCFAVAQWRLYRQTKEHRRDMRDLAKEGAWESELAKQSPQPETPRTVGAIGTGIEGLEESIESRRRAGAGATAATGGAQ